MTWLAGEAENVLLSWLCLAVSVVPFCLCLSWPSGFSATPWLVSHIAIAAALSMSFISFLARYLRRLFLISLLIISLYTYANVVLTA